MLDYKRIDLSKGFGINKTDFLREFIICHYWYFLEMSFEFQPEVCNDCRGLMQKAMSYNVSATDSVKGNDCRIHFLYTSKDEAISLLKNADLIEKF